MNELTDLEIPKLPKLYRSIYIRFSSLRNGVGSGLGVIFDIDTMVIQKCRRVRTSDGWKWQLCSVDNLMEWDYMAETDQEVLDEYTDEIEFKVSDFKSYISQFNY
jgi:hypothetical protein